MLSYVIQNTFYCQRYLWFVFIFRFSLHVPIIQVQVNYWNALSNKTEVEKIKH